MPTTEIQKVSNERLEEAISSYYYEMYSRGNHMTTPKSRVLDALWHEFDTRIEEKRI